MAKYLSIFAFLDSTFLRQLMGWGSAVLQEIVYYFCTGPNTDFLSLTQIIHPQLWNQHKHFKMTGFESPAASWKVVFSQCCTSASGRERI